MAKLKVPVSPADHAQGPADAPVTLVEYGDYECPHCGHAYPIVKALQKRFGKQLRFVFRNFPLREIHPNAEAAAETAEFAATQDKFWEMHDLIYENQQDLSDELLSDLANRLKLDARELARALEVGRIRRTGAEGFFRRRSQWSERNADILYQWPATRRATSSWRRFSGRSKK